jgi:glycosyltransferase involved in cell wall biosynthesis
MTQRNGPPAGRRLRVLYVTANSLLRSTTSSLNAILEQLRPRGLEPVMLFREPGPWQQALADDGVPCYFDPLLVPGKDRPLGSLRDIWRLTRLIRTERIDLLHANEHEHYALVRQLARWSGRPAVVTLHWNLDGYGLWAFRPPYQPAAVQFLSRAQLEVSRPGLPPDLPPDRVKLLMSGLAIDAFLARGGDGRDLRRQWGVEPGTVVFGTASALKPRKHVEDFVRLIARLRRRGLPVLGLIAGGGRYADPDYQAMLEQLIRDERLEGHCRLLGNLDPVTPFFKAIDVSVNTAEMEILSMSLCEAQACGKPTLAYAVGGNPEALPDEWCHVPFGDLDALEEKAARLATDPDGRRDLGARAERFVREHFDAPVLAARQAAIYEEILGRPLARPATPTPEAVCPS